MKKGFKAREVFMVSGILEVYIFVKCAVSFRDGNRFGDYNPVNRRIYEVGEKAFLEFDPRGVYIL